MREWWVVVKICRCVLFCSSCYSFWICVEARKLIGWACYFANKKLYLQLIGNLVFNDINYRLQYLFIFQSTIERTVKFDKLMKEIIFIRPYSSALL